MYTRSLSVIAGAVVLGSAVLAGTVPASAVGGKNIICVDKKNGKAMGNIVKSPTRCYGTLTDSNAPIMENIKYANKWGKSTVKGTATTYWYASDAMSIKKRKFKMTDIKKVYYGFQGDPPSFIYTRVYVKSSGQWKLFAKYPG